MTAHRIPALLLSFLMVCALALGDNTPPSNSKEPKLTPQDRLSLIRSLNAEIVYARKSFPQGRVGLTIKDGVVTPDDAQVQTMIAGYGPSLKPGDRAQITDIKFKDKSIVFEINGGAERKKKWYEHIEVSGMGGGATPGQPTENTNMRGSYVELAFDKYVPTLNPDDVKKLLTPVFDFNAKSPVEAYIDTVPPAVKAAIKDHKVLVGMNREMVTYAKGRPPQKHREKDGDTDYEEWIYGVPPQEVQFVRFVGDEVIRLEVMQVNGEKVIRTEKEVTMPDARTTTVAQQQGTSDTPPARPANAPSLRRPGEEVPEVKTTPVKTNNTKGPVTIHPPAPQGSDPRDGSDPGSTGAGPISLPPQ